MANKDPRYDVVKCNIYRKDLDRIMKWINVYQENTGMEDSTEEVIDWMLTNLTDGEVISAYGIVNS